jgi:hypothetical protein
MNLIFNFLMKFIRLKIVKNIFVASQVYILFQLYIPMNIKDVLSFGNLIRQISLKELLRKSIQTILYFCNYLII